MNRRNFIIASAGALIGAACSSSTDSNGTSEAGTAAPGSAAASDATVPTIEQADTTAPESSAATTRSAAGGTVPRPIAFVRTSWATDPYANGAYSFMAVGAAPELREALADPIDDRVFFAGEATNGENPSTVHGAKHSGERVADEILEVADAGERIAVIGSGISGAQAARLLADAGMQVTVIEARDRIGGRLDTVQPDGWPVPVERGASWVHDTSASDLPQVLQQLKVATVPFDYDLAAGIDAEGERFADDALDDSEAALEAAVGWADGKDADQSLADALAGSGEAAKVDSDLLQHYLDSEISTEYGADADELSAYWGLEEGSEGDDILVVGGYGTIVRSLLEGLEVRVSSPVTAIAHDDGGVRVTSGGAEETFDRVVVTLPLGVLKAGSVAFEPALPAAKQDAIDRIGFGLLDKLWLLFDEPFWSEDSLMWTVAGDGYGEFFNLQPLADAPVLLALAGGAKARHFETLTDDEVIDAAVASLQRLVDAGW